MSNPKVTVLCAITNLCYPREHRTADLLCYTCEAITKTFLWQCVQLSWTRPGLELRGGCSCLKFFEGERERTYRAYTPVCKMPCNSDLSNSLHKIRSSEIVFIIHNCTMDKSAQQQRHSCSRTGILSNLYMLKVT
jgi:hypothetical protein